MLLTPRYDQPDLLRIDLSLGDPSVPLLRQRRRLADTLAGLDDSQWAAPSRCEGWSVRDVVSHLATTNQFWAFAMGSGLAGEPTRFLTTFDPVASPAELVDAAASQTPAEVLDLFVQSNDAIADVVADVDADGWSSMLAEAPPGHLPLRAVAAHALWDSWIHERDVVLPLGLPPVVEPDEVAECLAYAAALSPLFSVTGGSTRSGTIAVAVSHPELRFVVEVGASVAVGSGDAPADALHLVGDAVELTEALSHRGPMPCPVPEEQRWLLDGLAEVFDTAV